MNKKIKLPLYREIVNDIIRKIESGEWPKGEKIPASNELVSLYSTSRMTILKVIHILEEEGYVTVEHGRGTIVRRELAGQRIGLLLGEDILAVPPPLYMSALINKIRNRLQKKNYQVSTYIVQDYLDKESPYPNPTLALDMRRKNLEGLLTIGTDPMPILFQHVEEKQIPFVNLGAQSGNSPNVQIDLQNFIKETIHFLKAQKITKVGYISISEASIPITRQDIHAYGLVIEEQWCKCYDDFKLAGKVSMVTDIEAAGFELFRDIWQSTEKPEAIIISDDILAKGASQGAIREGLYTPEDVRLICATNSGTPHFFPTGIDQYVIDTDQVAQKAVQTILNQIQQKNFTRHNKVIGKMVPYKK